MPGKESRSGYISSPSGLHCISVLHLFLHLAQDVSPFGGQEGLRKAKHNFACIWDSVKMHQDAHGVEGGGSRRTKSTKFLKNCRV